MYINGSLFEADQILLIFFAVLGIFALLCISFYLLEAFAIMKMGKKIGVKNSWLAFVPFVSAYIFGRVAFKNKTMSVLYLCLSIVSRLFTILYLVNIAFTILGSSFVLDILSNAAIAVFEIAFLLLSFYAAYEIYEKFSNKAVVMFIFDVLSCGLLSPIFLFSIRNNELRIKSK